MNSSIGVGIGVGDGEMHLVHMHLVSYCVGRRWQHHHCASTSMGPKKLESERGFFFFSNSVCVGILRKMLRIKLSVQGILSHFVSFCAKVLIPTWYDSVERLLMSLCVMLKIRFADFRKRDKNCNVGLPIYGKYSG